MTEPTDVLYCAAVYPHHPAMERMAMPYAADYETLRRSIKEHGVRVPLILFVDIDGKESLLDGRGRVKAMEELGIPVLGTDCVLDTSTVHCAEDGREWAIRCERYYAEQGADPDKIVADLNLARRQLTVQQKRDYVANLLKASPERSNNSTARIAGVSDHTVASIRATLGTTSQIAKLPNRTGADGKTRAMPAARRSVSGPKVSPVNEAQPASEAATPADHPIPIEANGRQNVDLRLPRADSLLQIDFPPPEDLFELAATDPTSVERFVTRVRAWLDEYERRFAERAGWHMSSC
jgi:hypothetical protein